MSNKIQNRVKVTNPTHLYQKNSEHEQLTDPRSSKARQNLNHRRSTMTNCDEIIRGIIDKQGYITTEQRQEITDNANAEIFAFLYEQHIKVIEVAQKNTQSLKKAMEMAGVASVNALCDFIEKANKDRLSK